MSMIRQDAHFVADQNLSAFQQSLAIPQDAEISFYEGGMEDLRLSFGSAEINGTIIFDLKRDPSNPQRIVINSLTIDAIVSDLYDFDWTRDRGSKSRQGATVQIGWQPSQRNAGSIFATETVIQRRYDSNDGAIVRFNSLFSIGLP